MWVYIQIYTYWYKSNPNSSQFIDVLAGKRAQNLIGTLEPVRSVNRAAQTVYCNSKDVFSLQRTDERAPPWYSLEVCCAAGSLWPVWKHRKALFFKMFTMFGSMPELLKHGTQKLCVFAKFKSCWRRQSVKRLQKANYRITLNCRQQIMFLCVSHCLCWVKYLV